MLHFAVDLIPESTSNATNESNSSQLWSICHKPIGHEVFMLDGWEVLVSFTLNTLFSDTNSMCLAQ